MSHNSSLLYIFGPILRFLRLIDVTNIGGSLIMHSGDGSSSSV